jgi:hypothetical protein
MKIELGLLLYNRPRHAAAVLDSLEACGAHDVRVFMDAPADEEVAANQQKMLDDLARRSRLNIELHRHAERKGLARSVRHAMEAMFSRAEGAILLEDDCVLLPGGLQFLSSGLRALQHESRVRSLCAYLYPCAFVRGDGEPLAFRRFCTWGWATWRDRWRDYEVSLPAILKKLAARGIRVEQLGADIAQLCHNQAYLEGRVDIWSLPWILEHYATDTFAVYPCDSLIDNIGFDGSGTNSEQSGDFTVAARAAPRPWNFSQLGYYYENEELLRRFLDQHGLKAYPRG